MLSKLSRTIRTAIGWTRSARTKTYSIEGRHPSFELLEGRRVLSSSTLDGVVTAGLVESGAAKIDYDLARIATGFTGRDVTQFPPTSEGLRGDYQGNRTY